MTTLYLEYWTVNSTIEQLPDMSAAEVHERSNVGDLVDEEELTPGSPGGPPGQHGLHELDEPHQVVIIRPERPEMMMVEGFIERMLTGIVDTYKHACNKINLLHIEVDISYEFCKYIDIEIQNEKIFMHT